MKSAGYHVEVEESEEEEEGVAVANGARGPEHSQYEGDVAEERQVGGVHGSICSAALPR